MSNGRRAVFGGGVMGVGIVGSASYRPDTGLRCVGNDEVHDVVRRHGFDPMRCWQVRLRRRWTTPASVVATSTF